MSKKIYIVSYPNQLEDDSNVVSFALCEDGYIVAKQISSNIEWAKHDMGLTSNWKHKDYAKHCPDGYELEYVDYGKQSEHIGFQIAYALNQEKFNRKH